jgi:hypothetical protein
MRTRLRTRHASETTIVHWESSAGPSHKLIITFGFDRQGIIKEAFCASFKGHSEMCALANDACIILSKLLQHGESIADVSNSLGENRGEGDTHGPPASILGAIARKGAEVQQWDR